MRILSDPAFLILGATGVGWMAARGSYVGVLGFAAVTLAVWADFNRGYRNDLAAAKKWREMRWAKLKELEKRYRDEIYAQIPPSVADFDARLTSAERRARNEIAEQYGLET